MTNKSLPLPLCPDVKAQLHMGEGGRSGKITFSNPEFPAIGFVLKPIDKRGQIFEAAYMTTDDKPLLGYRLISRSLPGQPLSVVDVLRGLRIERHRVRCAPKQPNKTLAYEIGFYYKVREAIGAHQSHTADPAEAKRAYRSLGDWCLEICQYVHDHAMTVEDANKLKFIIDLNTFEYDVDSSGRVLTVSKNKPLPPQVRLFTYKDICDTPALFDGCSFDRSVFLWAVEGYTQEMIGFFMGVSPSKISRILNQPLDE